MKKQIFHLIALILLTTSPGMSQNDFCVWQPENGVAIRQGWHIRLAEEGAYRSEGELAGETALIWGDHRNGDRDIFLQVLDSEGEFKFDELGYRCF